MQRIRRGRRVNPTKWFSFAFSACFAFSLSLGVLRAFVVKLYALRPVPRLLEFRLIRHEAKCSTWVS